MESWTRRGRIVVSLITKNKPQITPNIREVSAPKYRTRSRWFLPNIPRLIVNNIKLRREINALRMRINTIEERIPEQKTIVMRSIPMEQAKKEIQALFNTGKEYYYSDIAQEFGLSLKAVVDICREMQENEEIGIVQ